MAGCDRSQPEEPPETARLASASDNCLTGSKGTYPEPLGPMFAAAFGEAAPFRRSASDGCYVYEPAEAIPLGGTTALISGATGPDCHACSGTLSVHYLQGEGESWRLAGAWRDISDLAAWGKVPQWKLRNDLTPHPALELTVTDGNQGYFCTLVSLIELTPTAPVVRIPATAIGYDSSGVGGDEAAHIVTAEMVAIPAGGITVRYSGDRTGELRFTRTDGEYVAAGTNPVEGCQWEEAE